MACILVSIVAPEVITPFAHGIPMQDSGDGVFIGARQYKYIRAFFGLSVSTVIAVVVMFMTRPEPLDKYRGLVWGTIDRHLNRYKGSDTPRRPKASCLGEASEMDVEQALRGEGKLSVVNISEGLSNVLDAHEGDLLTFQISVGGLVVYVRLMLWWEIQQGSDAPEIAMGPETYAAVVLESSSEMEVTVDRLY